MRRASLLVAVLALVPAAGCALDGEGTGAPPTIVRPPSGKADGVEEGAIAQLAGGHWLRYLECPAPDPSWCKYTANVWVDLAIRDDAFDKWVGVAWIDERRDDPAAPWHVALGRYEGELDDGRERWGVDLETPPFVDITPRPQIRYASFVAMGGKIYWDNNGGADHRLP